MIDVKKADSNYYVVKQPENFKQLHGEVGSISFPQKF